MSDDVIWERPEPDERRAATRLSRAQIVQASVGLADGEGLAAVSIRNVAAALGIRPMRLYTHVNGKDDLLWLMIDSVYGEIGVDSEAQAWEEQVRAHARAFRSAILRHPWAIDLLGFRPYLGPRALEVSEALAAALARAPGCDDPGALRIALGLLNSYLLGALRREVGELRAHEASGLDTGQWQRALGPYLGRQLATGKLPMVESIIRAPDLSPAETFEAELNLVLRSATF